MLLMISFSGQSKNIATYFVDMPLILMPTLESSYRLELVEIFTESGRDTLENSLGSTVTLLNLDTVNQHIAVRSTSVSRFEMQLITHRNDTLIGIINTVCAPLCSSYIKFYNTDWQEVKVDFPKFSNKSWYKVDISNDAKKIAERLVKMSLVELAFEPAEKVITAKNNSLENLNEDERASLAESMTKAMLKVPFESLCKK